MIDLFLFFIAFAFVIFASVQDLRTREIADWLNFSLIAFVLAYRALYSVYFSDVMFFVYGVLGVLFFVAVGYGLYYGRAFAGGDAKLLFGIGGVLPYTSYFDVIYFGLAFVLLLFGLGAVYSLVYSFFIASRKKGFFGKFVREIKKNKILNVFSFSGLILFFALGIYFDVENWFYLDVENWFYLGALLLGVIPIVFSYVHVLERECMIKLVNVKNLTEGDWVVKEFSVAGRKFSNKFSGLTKSEVLFLKKHGKKVLIKDGIPFAPAFLFALVGFILFLRYSSF